jgi:hypothetical protein
MKRNLPARWIILHLNSVLHFKNRFSTRIIWILFICLSPFITRSQQWQILANEQQIASAASSFTHIATALDGAITVPYVVYTEAGIAKVKKYDGDNWIAVGSNVSDGNATHTRIYIDDNGKIYVSYVDAANGNRLAVKTFNESTGTWEPLNGDANNLYLSVGSVTNTIGQFNSTPRSSLAFASDNTPYIIYAEGAGLNPFVKRFNGSTWEIVGGDMVSAQRAIGVSIAIDNNDIPYIVYINHATATSSTGNLIVYKLRLIHGLI